MTEDELMNALFYGLRDLENLMLVQTKIILPKRYSNYFKSEIYTVYKQIIRRTELFGCPMEYQDLPDNVNYIIESQSMIGLRW